MLACTRLALHKGKDMSEEEKQALIAWLMPQIREMETACDEIPFGLDVDDAMQLKAMRVAMSALTAQPVACKKRLVNHRSGLKHAWTYHGEIDKASQGDVFRVEVIPLFERPVPAINLAELVPNPSDNKYWRNDGYGTRFNVQTYHGDVLAILRNIEEKSQ